MKAFPKWQRRLAVLAPVGAVVVFVALLLLAMQQRRDATAEVLTTHQLIDHLNAMRTRLLDAETGQRGFVITGDSAYLQPYRGGVEDVVRIRDAIAAAVAGDPLQVAAVVELDRLIEQRFEILRRPMDARSELGLEAARDTLIAAGGFTAMANLRHVLLRMETLERERLAAFLALQERTFRLSLLIMILGAAAVVTVAVLTGNILRHHAEEQEQWARHLSEANDKLQEQALELELQADELNASNETLEQQRAHLEELTMELEFSNLELQGANGQLEERTAEAEHANRAKTEFLAAMSHELRTPLNAIVGYVDLLQLGVHGRLNDGQLQSVERVRRNSSHLLNLINDVLHFAQLRVDPVSLRREPVAVEVLLSETAAMVQPLAGAKRILFTAGPHDESAPVQGDPDRIRQILLNLISNAVKYTDEGGRVELATQVDGERVRIRVRDTGIGIPPDKQELIFDPFVQLRRSAGGGLTDGVGLGLAISRHLARAMDGDISVESSPGGGSVFTLILPRARHNG
jgi:signal transduction histidine kinase